MQWTVLSYSLRKLERPKWTHRSSLNFKKWTFVNMKILMTEEGNFVPIIRTFRGRRELESGLGHVD